MRPTFISICLAVLVLTTGGLYACHEKPADGDGSSRGVVHLPSEYYHPTKRLFDTLAYREKVYVPVYSDIYILNGEKRMQLTGTLSVRNTSLRDTLYVGAVDYYDSQGALMRHYLDYTIELYPLQSVEFIVEYREEAGGAGANFMVSWGMDRAEAPKPIIQAVMIGAAFSQGISFLTEGKVIEVDTARAQ